MKQATRSAIYTIMYEPLAEAAREAGYALAVHGSMMRDFDLVAIPWTIHAEDPIKLIDRFMDTVAVFQVGEIEERIHNRLVVTLAFAGDCFIDLSIMKKAV